MQWLTELFTAQPLAGQAQPIATAIIFLAIVAATGLALGSIRVYGIGLGIAGVLFTGLIFGYLGWKLDDQVLHFAQEFGLILFVYTIGMQVGPGFLASLRREGLPLNLMTAGIVVGGALVAVGIFYLAGVEMPVVVGLFSGGTTNTPSLAAAGEALRNLQGHTPEEIQQFLKMPGVGYAVAYPFGIIGIILTMILLRFIARINLDRESEALTAAHARERVSLARRNIRVENPNLVGRRLNQIPTLNDGDVVISRIMKDGKISVPSPATVVSVGDVLLAVGPEEKLAEFEIIVGKQSDQDLMALPSLVTSRKLIVTKKTPLGKTIDELGFLERFGVTITRLNRAGIEFTPSPMVRIQFGDTVNAVGEEGAISQVARELGNSTKTLDHPQIIPIFVGIALGVILGSWPIQLPGVPAPVKLGLAGGPLLVAIFLSHIGRIGPVVWFMPRSANVIMREIGIVLFLACVGLRSGDSFVAALTQGQGFYWMGLAALITFVPLMSVALIGRFFLKKNYLTLCGMLAGSMTDPPALAFAGAVTGSEEPSVAYATVYPLTMILRVLCAQLMVLLFMQ